MKDEIIRLSTVQIRHVEAERIARRAAWFEDRGYVRKAAATPREGYDLFIRDYLGLTPDEVPVIAESEREITWISKNPCPHVAGLRAPRPRHPNGLSRHQ